MRVDALLGLAILGTAACSPNAVEPAAGGSWVGAISTEGDVTTVINESGSVWGGAATLVEEASIGVESGADEYLLGRVGGVAADDERIYALDTQLPALRVHDLEGVHQFDIAPIGQGPGEFREPNGFVLSPAGVLFVTDFGNGLRLVAFDRDGTPLSTRTVNGMSMAAPLQAYADGVVTLRLGFGIGDFAPDGSISNRRRMPEIDMRAWSVRTTAVEGWSASTFYVPKAPGAVWSVLPSGALAVADSGTYRINVEHAEGGRRIIERDAQATTMKANERRYYEQYLATRLRRSSGIVEGEIPPIPETKPYLSRLIGTHDGSLWVVRPGPGIEVPDCADFSDPLEMMRNPCWVDETRIEVFGAEGRYLGEIEVPAGFRTVPAPHIRGDQVIAVVEDDAGTIMVKRYRLILPRERDPQAGVGAPR